MATKKFAGAGRGFVNPQRTDESDDDYITPKQLMSMENEAADRKAGAAAEAAYNKAAGMKKGGKVSASNMGSVRTAKPTMSSASSRGDGIATKGKTRGTMIAMCGGGKAKK